MVTYLNYFLDCVGTADNYAYFFHIAQRVKQGRDGLEDNKSEVLPLQHPPLLTFRIYMF